MIKASALFGQGLGFDLGIQFNNSKASKKTKRNHVEEDIQAACVQWFRYQYPKLSMNLFAIPNALAFTGESRKAFFGKIARLKNMGLVKGVPDLFLAVATDGFSGLFIEMKKPGEKLSKEQSVVCQNFLSHGYDVIVCDSVDQFMCGTKRYLS